MLTPREWRERLTEEQYHILREGGTECAFQNAYFENYESGIYQCAGCALPLFRSQEKYDSGTGWPSFWDPLYPENIELRKGEHLLSSTREVVCARCGGHLGHLFADGPPSTGKRYCMNSAALRFTPDKEE